MEPTPMEMKSKTEGQEVTAQVAEIVISEKSEPKELELLDNAALFVQEREGLYPEIDEAEMKKIVRKVDFCLVPMLFITATMGAVDKLSLSTAAIYGLRTDTHLVGQQYSWLGSIIFFGSMAGMWPMTYLVQKFRLGKTLATCSAVWSALTLILSACNDFQSMMGVRFLMGFAECVIVPGCTLSAGMFYMKKEQGIRLSVIFAFGSSVVNGFLSWLVGNFGDAIPKWKYLYLMVGSISFSWSLLMLYLLPDSPMDAKFLDDRQKYYLVKRVLKNNTGVETNDWKMNQMKEAFLDVKAYVVFLFNIGINIPNGGLSTFSSVIINNLNFDAMKSSLMGIPTGVIATIAMVFFTYFCGRYTNRRSLIAIIALFFPLIGAIILYTVSRERVGAQLVGLYFLYFYFAPYVVLMSLSQANTAGNTKKSVTYSINYYGYCVGSIIGPQTFRAEQAPQYTGGFTAMIVAYIVCMALAVVYWSLCFWENKKKKSVLAKDNESNSATESSTDLSEMKEELFDSTDKEQKHFFYTT